MSIEIGSKWVKDGEVVDVKVLTSSMFVEIVWYSKNGEKEHVITKDDFLEQYKPVTFEYMYAFNDAHNICRLPTSNFYKDDEEFELYHPNKTEYQRLDFTKRERKC